MQVIRDILAELGVESIASMEVNESYRIERDGFNDLVIEKVMPDRLSVAHVYTQMGDLMRDPEVVFDTSNGDDWTPIEFQQDPGMYQHDEDGLPSVATFCRTWNENIRSQGFVDAARDNV